MFVSCYSYPVLPELAKRLGNAGGSRNPAQRAKAPRKGDEKRWYRRHDH